MHLKSAALTVSRPTQSTRDQRKSARTRRGKYLKLDKPIFNLCVWPSHAPQSIIKYFQNISLLKFYEFFLLIIWKLSSIDLNAYCVGKSTHWDLIWWHDLPSLYLLSFQTAWYCKAYVCMVDHSHVQHFSWLVWLSICPLMSYYLIIYLFNQSIEIMDWNRC